METMVMLEKPEGPKSWAATDFHQEDYRTNWSMYRNSAQENKENIDWKEVSDTIPVIDDNHACQGDFDKGVDEPMEILESLSACTIDSTETTDKDEKPAEPAVPIKRARIVKPPQDYTPERMSAPGTKPFSFLERERENQERREARRAYYDMLNKKSTPQPFKARPAPKFKPIAIQTPKKIEPRTPSNTRVSTPAPQTQKVFGNAHVDTPVPKRTWISKFTGSLLQTPTGSPTSPQVSGISKQPMNKTPSTPSRIPLRAMATPKTATPSPQTPKSASGTPRRMVTIPKSPQLSTAIRARERRQFEEAMKEKERQRDYLRKMELATIQAHERDAVAQLRRSSVHKPLTNLSAKGIQSPLPKRPLTHPLLPIFVKRPRWI